MTTMRRDPLVDDYLRRLEAAAAGLPRERRAELVGLGPVEIAVLLANVFSGLAAASYLRAAAADRRG